MNSTLAQTLDIAVAMGVYSLVHNRIVTNDPQEVSRYIEQCRLFEPGECFALPEQALELPERPGAPRTRRFRRRRPYWTHQVVLPSAIETPFAVNNRQPGRWYYPQTAQPKGTILFLHGVMAFNYWGYEWITQALAGAGWQVLFVHLPYHLERTPPGRRPGEFFVLGDLVRSIEMARQGVVELRQVIQALQTRGQGPVGLVGVSLGGWYGGFLATLEEALDFAVLIVPALDMRTVYSESPLSIAVRQRKDPVPLESLNRILLGLSPLNRDLVLPARRLALMAGEWDVLVPTRIATEAQARWQPGVARYYPGGHISLAFSKRLRRELVEIVDGMRDR